MGAKTCGSRTFRQAASKAPNFEFFAGVYGYRSLVIDGQCRFWQTKAGDGWVYAGTLDPSAAQDLAEAIGYGQLSAYSAFVDSPCPDGTVTTLAAPEGRIRCSCQCTTSSSAPEGWRAAFRAISPEMTEALLASGETVTGPARLVLSSPGGIRPGVPPEPWPLDRPPAAGEIVQTDVNPLLAVDAGALIEDPAELTALRSFRELVVMQNPTWILGFYPAVWVAPAGQGEQLFDIFIRDEVPEKVRTALLSAQGP